MMAVLRYLVLKTWRDRSFWLFLLAPLMLPVSVLIGGSIVDQRALHYPFLMAGKHSPAENAAIVVGICTVTCALFAILPAFWTLRSEIASRSVASFALATRPVLLVLSVMLLAISVVCIAWSMSIGTIVLLTTAWPAGLAATAMRMAIATVAGSAIGIACVSVSVEAPMIIAAYACGFSLVIWLQKAKTAGMYVIPLAAAVLLAGVATYFLERRCAS